MVMTERKGTRANIGVTRLAVASNVALTVAKLVIGFAMSSVAVIAEGVHSAVDLLAALMAFWAVKKAGRPADVDHAFGHGKYDALSGAVEGLLIFAASLFIIAEAVRNIVVGAPLERLGWGAAVMAASALINYFVSGRLFAVAARTGSVAVEADGHHLRTDVWTSLAVLGGLALIKLTGLRLLDPLVALAVAALILRTAWRITAKAFGDLLDRSLPAAEERRIREIIRDGHPHWLDFHHLRTRRAGGQRHIDLHLVTCRDIPLELAHRLSEDLESDIRKEFSAAAVVTHVEPCERPPSRCNAACPMFEIKENAAGRRRENR